MKKSELIQTERIFYPGWLMVSQLRGGQEVRDGEGLYRRARRLVQDAKVALTEAGYSNISRDHMVYALCALLDESVMNRGTTDDGYRGAQRRQPAQSADTAGTEPATVKSYGGGAEAAALGVRLE